MDLNGNRIIAVDFDGTLCENDWPGIGPANKRLIRKLIKEKEKGTRLILWTCRYGIDLENAVKWCEDHGLTFDTVNENLPELVELYKNDCRKINADIYIDDKAVNPLYYRQKTGLYTIDIYNNKRDRNDPFGD